MIRIKLLVVFLLLALPMAAGAATIQIQTGTDGGFGFSTVHLATGAKLTLTGADGNPDEFYRSGSRFDLTSGLVLTGDLSGGVITGITGSVPFSPTGPGGLTTLEIIDGTLDLGRLQDSDYDHERLVGTLVTKDLGTFYFFDDAFGGPANSYDPTTGELRLWGNNWNGGTRDDAIAAGITPYGIDIGGHVAVPEPGAALLSLVAFAFVGFSGRRR